MVSKKDYSKEPQGNQGEAQSQPPAPPAHIPAQGQVAPQAQMVQQGPVSPQAQQAQVPPQAQQGPAGQAQGAQQPQYPAPAQPAQVGQQGPVAPQTQQAQVAPQAQQGPAGRRAQAAQQPRIPVPVTPENQAALRWLEDAVRVFYPKPQAHLKPRDEPTDPFKGRELRLEFIEGSLRGNAGQRIEKVPAVRLTAGGRPVARAPVDFEVSDGNLGNAATTIKLVTDARGIARIPAWTLGAARPHAIAAEFRSVRAERTVKVDN